MNNTNIPPNANVPNLIVVNTPFVPGYRIVEIKGFVWGLIVRSRGLGGNIVANLRSIVGGEIDEYTKLLDETRHMALNRLIISATNLGANAVVSVNFDSTELVNYMTEILAYGTAVVVEKETKESQSVKLT